MRVKPEEQVGGGQLQPDNQIWPEAEICEETTEAQPRLFIYLCPMAFCTVTAELSSSIRDLIIFRA